MRLVGDHLSRLLRGPLPIEGVESRNRPKKGTGTRQGTAWKPLIETIS